MKHVLQWHVTNCFIWSLNEQTTRIMGRSRPRRRLIAYICCMHAYMDIIDPPAGGGEHIYINKQTKQYESRQNLVEGRKGHMTCVHVHTPYLVRSA
jgi:hypothetical protein